MLRMNVRGVHRSPPLEMSSALRCCRDNGVALEIPPHDANLLRP